MVNTNQKIYNVLINDATLLALLAENAPFHDSDGTASKANSIVPADVANRKMETPFITIQEGNENKSGKVLIQSFYIRCYNNIKKSYITINEILDRVRSLLDGSDLTLTDRRHIKTTMESRLPGLVEEGMELKFKEERFRVEVL